MAEFKLGDAIIDSLDIIERIEELSAGAGAMVEACDDSEDGKELALLREIEKQGEGYGDWEYGATLIRDLCFEKHIAHEIDECYELPAAVSSGEWPWRHMSIDYEAAAEEAKADYTEIEAGGYTYYMLAV